ncbi:MAG TPA: hypothetical protein VFT41_11310 [Gemmatimonadaceae bacterium]|nr:hypothetical protein [Gemmatimonadaceae bacterium]
MTVAALDTLEAAEICALPAATPRTSPLASTVATPGACEAHVTFTPLTTFPLPS